MAGGLGVHLVGFGSPVLLELHLLEGGRMGKHPVLGATRDKLLCSLEE